MAIKPHIKGNKYAVSFWVDSEGECAVENYILELLEKNDSDAESILRLFDRTATTGLIANEEKFRFLKGNGQGLVEFKARGGTRVLGFIIDETRIIICTHGMPKLKEKRFKREVEKAQEIKQLYLIENLPEASDYVN